MKKFIAMLLVWFGCSAWIMFYPPEEVGYLLISFGSKTIEMSLLFAALLTLTLLMGIWLCWALFKGGLAAVKNLSGSLMFGSERAQKRTTSGLIDFIEGNWLQAHKKLLRAATKVEAPLVNYLAAARSAYEMGNQDEAARLLAHAAKTTTDSSLAIALTQARMELLSKDYDKCLATLLKVKPLAPQNPVLLDLLRQVYLAQQDWDGLQRIFERLRSYKIGSPHALVQLEIQIYSEQLKKEGEVCQTLVQAERLGRLKSAWNKVPANVQKNLVLLAVYVRQLADNSEDQEAEMLIRKALSKEWHEEMVYLYGRLRSGDIRQQIRIAEDWLQQHPQDPVLLLTLGRLSMRNELWGKAREYFKASLSAKRDPEVYAELARLLEHMGELQQSHDATENAIGLVVAPLPDLPLPKRL